MKAKTVSIAVLVLTAACAKVTDIAPPELTQKGYIASPADVVLAVGTEVRVDSLLRLGFVNVEGDSRCPSSVVCIWAGDGHAVLAAAVGSGPASPVHLHTTLDPRAADVGGYRIALSDLMPYPDRPGAIPQGAYVVRLHVERLIR